VTRDTWVKDREESDEDVRVEIERLLDQLDEGEDEEEEPSKLEETQGDREEAATNTKKKGTRQSESDEAVFAQSYIPRALDDVYDPERDVQRVLRGEGGDLIYADITGVAKIHKEDDEKRGGAEEGSEQEDGSDDESGSDSGSEEGEEKRPRGKKHEDKEDKKVRFHPLALSPSRYEI